MCRCVKAAITCFGARCSVLRWTYASWEWWEGWKWWLDIVGWSMSRWTGQVDFVGDEEEVFAIEGANGWAALFAREGTHHVLLVPSRVTVGSVRVASQPHVIAPVVSFCFEVAPDMLDVNSFEHPTGRHVNQQCGYCWKISFLNDPFQVCLSRCDGYTLRCVSKVVFGRLSF